MPRQLLSWSTFLLLLQCTPHQLHWWFTSVRRRRRATPRQRLLIVPHQHWWWSTLVPSGELRRVSSCRVCHTSSVGGIHLSGASGELRTASAYSVCRTSSTGGKNGLAPVMSYAAPAPVQYAPTLQHAAPVQWPAPTMTVTGGGNQQGCHPDVLQKPQVWVVAPLQFGVPQHPCHRADSICWLLQPW